VDARVEAKPKEKKGEQHRRRIGPDDVKAAVAAAKDSKPGDDKIVDVNDIEQSYLTLRRRGATVRWIVRAYKQTRVIGSSVGIHVDKSYLTLRDAREKAKRVYAELADTVPAAKRAPVWTWADLDREYQALIARPRWIGNRMKPASEGTSDDVRLAFAKPSFQALHAKALTDLDRPTLNGARDKLESFRQRQKNVAYFKAAMTWAADHKPDESGLIEGVDRWWDRLTAGEPSADQMKAIEERRKVHRQRKADLDVTAIGETLARHEAYCAGRTAEDKISPGIRWGIWWVSFTANRRFSTVRLKRDDLLEQDPLGDPGWGRAAWPADTMKAKQPFWLPLPPLVRDIAAGSIADYTQLVKNQHGDWPSQWVFASTRRYGRDADNDDVGVYPNSLNRHLLRMRKDGALDGLPYFSLHLVRAAMGDFVEDKVNGVTSSLVLAHTLPRDDDEAAPTTKAYYLSSQRMAEKAEGMRVWSQALIAAFLKAGGTMPVPSETIRRPKSKPRR
jgi:hypothetical protein